MNDALPAIITAYDEVALPAHIVEATRDYRREALAPRTREAYADAWKQFAGWCAAMGRRAMPASPETVAAWATALADGHDRRKSRARKTIQLYVMAVIYMHRTAGHHLSTKDAEIRTLAGIARTKAKTQMPARRRR